MERPRFLYPWFWKDWYYKNISCLIWPRQRWLTKKIPREWRDKDSIIELVLYECLINYVEKDGEDCFNVIIWNDTKLHKERAKMIKKIYKWAKTDRAEFLKKIDNAYPKFPKNMFSSENFNDWFNTDKYGTYEEKYSAVIKLEKKFDLIDNEYLNWILNNRRILWS